VTFNAWPTYGYNSAHGGFNPNSALFTAASIPALHLGWQFKLAEAGTQTQPILVPNVAGHAGLLYVGGRSGIAYAIDALTGTQVWSRSLGTEQMQCVNGGPLLTLGIQATAVYDPASNAVYLVDGTNATPNASQTITIYKLDPATGNTLGSVNVTPANLPGEIDFSHTGLTLSGSTLYVGTGSTCDLSSWRGRLAAVNINSMTLGNTFFPVYNQGGAYSGGGVWGWGGAAVDAAGTVYVGAGNADFNAGSIGPQPPFQTTTNEQAGYGEHLVQLSGDLSTVLASHAVPYSFNGVAHNLDLSGTPVLMTPVGCPTLLAIQGKAGLLNFYNTAGINAGPLGTFTFSEAADEVSFIGNGAYSPLTNLYYANVPTAQGGSIEPPGLAAIGISNCSSPAIAWAVQFGADSYNIGSYDGAPRSAPTVTAGNVVFVASPTAAGTSQLWAIDATSGAVLNGGVPILTTSNLMRMPPVIDGKWMYVLDQGGNLYGLTLDPAIARKQARFAQSIEPRVKW
jgi:outer membrane protein assembly factor BamB